MTSPRGMAVNGLAPFLARLSSGASLTEGEAERCFDVIMAGGATDAEMAALLSGLRAKGVVPAEVAGAVRAMRRAMVRVEAPNVDDLVDTCGTGGGRFRTFNISTAASFVAAGAGVPVAKHGNRSHTSMSGSADVLEALGVRIDLSPAEMVRILEKIGIVFMFAPLLHPAMRHLAPVRRELGVPTIVNILGPLTNPAGVRRQVMGVYSPELVGLVVEALRELDHLRALVVHGAPGLDELSPSGPTTVAMLDGGEIGMHTVRPKELGLEPGDPEELRGGTPEENARMVEEVLAGKRSDAARTAVLLNAGAAVWASGREDSLKGGVHAAVESLKTGAAWRKLEELRSASQARGSRPADGSL